MEQTEQNNSKICCLCVLCTVFCVLCTVYCFLCTVYAYLVDVLGEHVVESLLGLLELVQVEAGEHSLNTEDR